MTSVFRRPPAVFSGNVRPISIRFLSIWDIPERIFFILSSGRFWRMSTISSNSNSLTASANSSFEILEIKSCCISSPNSNNTSPSSSVFKREKSRFLCLGGEDSRAWAISDDDILFKSLLIWLRERFDDSSIIVSRLFLLSTLSIMSF